MNIQNFIRPDIITMKPYTPILPFEVLSARLGRHPDEIVKLDANENPYGPSPQVKQAMANGKYFHIYPDPESNELRQALSTYVAVPKERLMAGARHIEVQMIADHAGNAWGPDVVMPLF